MGGTSTQQAMRRWYLSKMFARNEVRSVLHHCLASTYGGHFSQTRLLPRFFKRASVGLLSSRMQGNLFLYVINANERGIFPSDVRCLQVEFLRWSSLIFRELILWVCSLYCIIIYISSWQSTLSQHTWKLLPPLPMTPRW